MKSPPRWGHPEPPWAPPSFRLARRPQTPFHPPPPQSRGGNGQRWVLEMLEETGRSHRSLPKSPKNHTGPREFAEVKFPPFTAPKMPWPPPEVILPTGCSTRVQLSLLVQAPGIKLQPRGLIAYLLLSST